MRKLILLIVTLSIVISWQPVVEAKGPASRIVITSPVLDEDIIVEDDGLVALLSMTRLEDFSFELVEQPPDIDVGYELQRQHVSRDGFTTFDRAIYYPSTHDNKRGYVHYLGLVNGWSGFDNNWYNVRPEAELAINHILNSQHLNSYLIAYGGSGDILFLDPQTLDTQFTLDTQQKEWSYVEDDGASLDGTRLFFQMRSAGAWQQTVLDLAAMESCSLGTYAFIMPTLDGNHLLFQVGNTLQVRDAKSYDLRETITLDAEPNIHLFPNEKMLEAVGVMWNSKDAQLGLLRVDGQSFETSPLTLLDGVGPDATTAWDTTFSLFYISDGDQLTVWQTWNEMIDTSGTLGYSNELQQFEEAGVTIDIIGTHRGMIYYYPRLGRYQKWDTTKLDETNSGIFIARPYVTQSQNEHIFPDIGFQHVIMAGNTLYALETPTESDTSTIYRIDLYTGEIVSSTQVSPDMHYLGFEALDTTSFTGSEISPGECTIELP